MSYEIKAAPKEHFAWLVDRTQCAITPAFRAIEAMDANGEIKGMVGYDNWTLNAVQMHMAFETPAALRAIIPAGFKYPFSSRGVILGIIPSHNERSCELTRRLGFKEVYRIQDGWAKGDDMIVFQMRREECRYLEAEKEAA